MITLPTQKVKAETSNSKYLVYFGKPKVGKSCIASQLEDNLIIDLKDEYAHLTAFKVKANNLTELGEVINLIKKKNQECNGFAYKHITLDNATWLMEMISPLAAKKYRAMPFGKSWTGTNVLELPKGAGYYYLKEAFQEIIDIFRSLTPHFILICHVKDNAIDKDGEEINELSIDLFSSLARLISAEADSIAYVYRDKNKTIMDFNGIGNVIAQSRQEHLRGKKIVIAESDENNKVTTYWDRIYLPELTQTQLNQAA